MTSTPIAIILAAGQGTRMKSTLPKVLHPVANRSMVQHVLHAAQEAGCGDCHVVIGPHMDNVAQAITPWKTSVQTQALGTANAVLAAQSFYENHSGYVFILYGDTPLLTPETLIKMHEKAVQTQADIVVLGMEVLDPCGYGHLIVKNAQVQAIVEDKDATDEEKKITLCNAGLMLVSAQTLRQHLSQIRNDNAKQEYYLTDLVELVVRAGGKVIHDVASETEVLGVNDRVQLAHVEHLWQQKRRAELMRSGVTMIDPETVTLSYDTDIAPDVVLEPHIVFGPGVKIASHSVIKGFSHIDGAHIASHVTIGPFARLRPGTVLDEGVHIGNFVELKKAHVGKKSKINHLSYVGDAEIGQGVNIGAGTITCNYDGYDKHKTIIDDGVFIGSNTALIAPIHIHAGALVGAGSTLTRDVAQDDIAVARGEQKSISGGAKRFRQSRKKKES